MCRCGTLCQLTFFRVASVGQAASVLEWREIVLLEFRGT